MSKINWLYTTTLAFSIGYSNIGAGEVVKANSVPSLDFFHAEHTSMRCYPSIGESCDAHCLDFPDLPERLLDSLYGPCMSSKACEHH